MATKPAAPVDLPPDIVALSFEQALEELDGIVRRLEGGEATLDDAIAAYERGARLKRHCENRLRDAEERVEKIRLAAEGAVTAEPADLA